MGVNRLNLYPKNSPGVLWEGFTVPITPPSINFRIDIKISYIFLIPSIYFVNLPNVIIETAGFLQLYEKTGFAKFPAAKEGNYDAI